MTDTEKLAKILSENQKIVFLTGAGVSTNSGIPDFRGTNGIYAKGSHMEDMLSKQFLDRTPERFYNFYFETMFDAVANKEPNSAHKAMVKLEELGKDVTVITQNIDCLHQKAGSTNVIEVHGKGGTWSCKNKKEKHTVPSEKVKDYLDDRGCPRCPVCNKLLRPDIVLYGESLPEDAMFDATQAISRADVLIVCGTSLTVYPVAYLPNNFWGYKDNFVIINAQPTDYDNKAGLVFHKDIGSVLWDALEIMNIQK